MIKFPICHTKKHSRLYLADGSDVDLHYDDDDIIEVEGERCWAFLVDDAIVDYYPIKEIWDITHFATIQSAPYLFN